MSTDERPVLVAYDGSPESQAAVRAGAVLMPGRPLLVVSVWEPGLAMMMTPPSDELSGLTSIPPSAETMATVDRAQRDPAPGAAAPRRPPRPPRRAGRGGRARRGGRPVPGAGGARGRRDDRRVRRAA